MGVTYLHTPFMLKHLLELRTVQIFHQLDTWLIKNAALLEELLGPQRAKKVKSGWGTSAKSSGGLYWAIYDSTTTYIAIVWRNRQFWLKLFICESEPQMIISISQSLSLIAKSGCITTFIQPDFRSVDIYYEIPISVWMLLNKTRFLGLLRAAQMEIQVAFVDQVARLLHARFVTIPEAYAEEEFDVDSTEENIEED